MNDIDLCDNAEVVLKFAFAWNKRMIPSKYADVMLLTLSMQIADEKIWIYSIYAETA